MLKKTITYEDLDGNPITEDFYFHLSPAEIAEFEIEYGGDLGTQMKKVASTSDVKKIMSLFRDMIGRTVGKRSDDNKRFIKTPDIRDAFMQSDAYSVMFIEMVMDPQKAIDFMVSIVPKNIGERTRPEMQERFTEELKARGLTTDLRVDSAKIQSVTLDGGGAVQTAVQAKGVTTDLRQVDEANLLIAGGVVSTEVPARSIDTISRTELLEMDADTFHDLAGPARSWSKRTMGIAMTRRAGDKD